jgi:hypothetical protein
LLRWWINNICVPLMQVIGSDSPDPTHYCYAPPPSSPGPLDPRSPARRRTPARSARTTPGTGTPVRATAGCGWAPRPAARRTWCPLGSRRVGDTAKVMLALVLLFGLTMTRKQQAQGDVTRLAKMPAASVAHADTSVIIHRGHAHVRAPHLLHTHARARARAHTHACTHE